MNLATEQRGDVAIVRVRESRLVYPLLADFASTVNGLIGTGARKVIIDLSPVGYIDSATIGCLMDLYRQVAAVGGVLGLAGVQKRVEMMLTMTGAHHFIALHPDESAALVALGITHAKD